MFNNQIALITGAAAGIGRATALEFARKGATILAADMNETAGQALLKELQSLGATASFCKTDVSNLDEVNHLMEQCIQKYDRLDHLINNAGVAHELTFFEALTDEQWHRTIAVNQTGVFYCMRAGLKIMRNQKGGSIVNTASVAGLGAAPRLGAYAATKHAVVGLTKTAAHEYGKYNIRINCVCPSVISTNMGMAYIEDDEQVKQMLKSFVPMKRFGEPIEVAKAICWMSSKDASYLNGVALRVDGGFKA